MYAIACYIDGMLCVHATLLVCYLVGSTALPLLEDGDKTGRASALLRMLCVTGLGLALVGFVLFGLGMLGLLAAPWIASGVVALWLALCWWRRVSPLEPSYWRTRGRGLIAGWDAPSLLLYALMLVAGARAVLPNVGVNDAVEEHLAWAQDWALAHRIYVDPFIVFPFYASNFVLFFSAFIALHAAPFVNFLSWMMGLLSVLGIYAMLRSAQSTVLASYRSAIGFFLALALMLAAIFMQWMVTGYVDAAFGGATLLAMAAVQLAMRDKRAAWLFVSATIAGFLIGMKGSFILLIPIFGIALLWAASQLELSRRATVAVIALLLVAASPWYVRNLVLAGDPIPPVVNIARYGTDGLYTKDEWNALMGDATTSRAARDILVFPWRAFTRPTFKDFGELGATALFLLLYVPSLVALGALFLGKRLPSRIAIPIFVLSGLIAYYVVTTMLGRYALLFYPLLAVCVGLLLLECADKWPKLAPLAVLVAAVAAVPSLQPYLSFFWIDVVKSDFKQLAYHYPSADAYLDANEEGYREARFLVAWLRQHDDGGRVYHIGSNGGGTLNYYFRRQGVTSIGDWEGPAGFFRLAHAIDAGRSAEFMRDLDVDAVLMTPHTFLDAGFQHLLSRQLLAGGYRRLFLPASKFELFVRSG
jgi:hypothetical protein